MLLSTSEFVRQCEAQAAIEIADFEAKSKKLVSVGDRGMTYFEGVCEVIAVGEGIVTLKGESGKIQGNPEESRKSYPPIPNQPISEQHQTKTPQVVVGLGNDVDALLKRAGVKRHRKLLSGIEDHKWTFPELDSAWGKIVNTSKPEIRAARFAAAIMDGAK